MIGDSLTEQGLWSEMFPEHTIANRGVGSDTTADVLARMDTILATKPERAFIMLGVNDLALGKPYMDNYNRIISELRGGGGG